MTNKTAAIRYARALLDVAVKEKADLEQIEHELTQFADLFTQYPLLGKVMVNGRSLSGSTGLAVFPHDADDHEELIARADLQLREAKGHKSSR